MKGILKKLSMLKTLFEIHDIQQKSSQTQALLSPLENYEAIAVTHIINRIPGVYFEQVVVFSSPVRQVIDGDAVMK